MEPLQGVMALTYTPFKEDYSLNEEAVRQEIDWVIEKGATEEEVYLHHKMVLEETSLPIALYDSSPVGTYMGPDLVARIVAMSDRFIAMKAIVSDVCHMAGLYNLGLGEKLAIFGVEWNMLAHLLLGAPGAMGGSDWIPIMSATYRAFKAGDMKRAWDLQKEIVAQSPLLIPRIAAMAMGAGMDHSAVGYMKAKFSIMSGIDMGPPLPPYLPASEEELEKAKRGVARLNHVLDEH